MDKEDISILMKQLNIEQKLAEELLQKNSNNIVDAISNYIEPNNVNTQKQHYNTTYNESNEQIDKITELRTIVTDKESIFKKNHKD